VKRLPVVALLVASTLAVCTEPARPPAPESDNSRFILDSTRIVSTMLVVEDVAERVAPALDAADERDLLIERLRDVRRALAVRDPAGARSALDAAQLVLDRRVRAAAGEQKPDLAAIQLALDDVEELFSPRREQP
jgi:hypothetical protein